MSSDDQSVVESSHAEAFVKSDPFFDDGTSATFHTMGNEKKVGGSSIGGTLSLDG